MSMNPLQPVGAAAGAGALQPIYQLDPETAGAMKKCRERLHSICSQHMNRPVRVQTVHGQTHDGYIVHIDSDFIYLQIMPGHSRAFLPFGGFGPHGGFGSPAFNPYYNNVVLPLALFNLLAVSLLW
ncbi:hypothetical protein [Paenibacillus silviterrae]|uniref:hypothetical protein n=1 Tax=Paenibacillus silviterrae TaxID=3242194 RepID=UPI002543AD71|nr:hypothetical protein [Paenibacillus chinjuensis]